MELAAAEIAPATGWRSMVRQTWATGVPLLALCVVVSVLREGAFRPGDAVALAFAVAGLTLVMPGAVAELRRHGVIVAGAAVLLAWWTGSDVASGAGIAGMRLPSTMIVLAAGALAARLLPPYGRAALRDVVVWFGACVAVLGLTSLATGRGWWVLPDERSFRLAGPFAYPSAAGLFFVLCLIGTLASGEAIPSRVLRPTFVLATVATDSRGSLVALGVVVLVAAAWQRRLLLEALLAAAPGAPLVLLGQHRYGGRGDRGWVLALGVVVTIAVAAGAPAAASRWRRTATQAALPRLLGRVVVASACLGCVGICGMLLATQHHAVSGLDASWSQRLGTLHSAWTALLRRPWFGAGPDPTFPARTASGAPGIAYFAHDEPLEIALSVGVVGLAAAAALVALAVHRLGWWRRAGWRPVLAALVAAGLVDFVWHFAALGLAAAAVAGFDRSSPGAGLMRGDPRPTGE